MDELVLCLVSFNCRGWNNGCHYLTDFSDSFDICLVQENWLFNAPLNFNNHFLSRGVSGMEDGLLASRSAVYMVDVVSSSKSVCSRELKL